MKYGIISDIHSNLEALDSVLNALSKEGVDKYFCIGDIIGYGADPKKCIKKIQELNAITVLGNHEAGCIGLMDLSRFNKNAEKALRWTSGILDIREKEYLKTLNLVEKSFDCVFSHGTLENPEKFDYMIDAEKAIKSFQIMDCTILFVGHSHVAGVFEYKNGKAAYSSPKSLKIKKGSKYIVNAGSVGQPRDGNNKASYVVYDDAKKEIFIKRTPYDIKTAQCKILRAGLPPRLASRLDTGN